MKSRISFVAEKTPGFLLVAAPLALKIAIAAYVIALIARPYDVMGWSVRAAAATDAAIRYVAPPTAICLLVAWIALEIYRVFRPLTGEQQEERESVRRSLEW